MRIFDLFTERKSNSANNRHHSKFNRNAVRSRNLRLESLEERALLSAVPLSSSEYADLRAQYADFNLPENMADLNVITLDLAQGDGLSQLKSAITQAGTSTKSDLIVVRTSDTANTLTYTTNSNVLTINIDASQYGDIVIIGLGSKSFTLDANYLCRVMTISGNSTNVYLGGMVITHGAAISTKNNYYAYGGGIYNSQSQLTITNCKISNNTNNGIIGNGSTTISIFGGGIYNTGNLTVTNSTISNNTIRATDCAYAEGGGIYNTGTLTIVNSTISSNNATTTVPTDYVNYTPFAYTYGAGIYNTGTITVTNSSILKNTAKGYSASFGGGIYNNGMLTVTNSTLSENSAVNSSSYNSTNLLGGGIYNNNNGTLAVTNSTFLDNIATSGGGIWNGSNNTLTITSTTIQGNTGNGIVHSNNNLVIMDSIITGNVGYGIYSNSTCSVRNSIISENTNGIYFNSRSEITNSIISGNGYGIYNTGSSTSTISNNTIWGNTYGIYKSSGIVIVNNTVLFGSIAGTLQGSNNLSNYTGWSSGSNNLYYDSSMPLFVDAENGDYRLITDSQAINKGNNNFVETETDFAGNPRIFQNTVDIGAYENTDPEKLEFDTLYSGTITRDYVYGFTLTETKQVSFTHKKWDGLKVTLYHDGVSGEILAENIKTKELEAGAYSILLHPSGNDTSVMYSLCLTETPVGSDDTLTGKNGASLIDVLANDFDPAGNKISIVSLTQPQYGIAALLADGKILYIPDGNVQADSFTYTIEDEFGGQSTATVTITGSGSGPINPEENEQPVAQDDSVRVELNGHVLVDVLANDSDPDGDVLTILNVVQPANGTAVITKDDKILYLPKTGFAGTDSFTYTVSDGCGGTAEATVSVEVIRTFRPLIVTSNEASPALISEWETFNVELYGADGLAETQTIYLAWDASLFDLNTARAVSENGVSIALGAAVTENGITTQEVVLSVENTALLNEDALLASLEFLPVATNSLAAGDSSDWTISVNREALNIEVESFAFDLNDSGSVEINDLVAFARVFGQSSGESDLARIADFSGNGTVEINDLVLFARNFGKKRPSKPQATPAPTALPAYASTPKLEEMPTVERGLVNDAAMTAYLDEME